MIKRSIVLVCLLIPIWLSTIFYDTAVQPEIAKQLTLNSVNGDNTDAAALRSYHALNNRLMLQWTLDDARGGVRCLFCYPRGS